MGEGDAATGQVLTAFGSAASDTTNEYSARPIAYSTKIGLVDNLSKIDDPHMMITAIWRRVICVYSVLYLRVVPLGWEVTLCTDEAMAKGGMVGLGGMKGYKEGQGDGSRQWKDYAGKELRGESKREGRARLPTANGKAYTL